MSDSADRATDPSVAALAREVEEFVASAGWEQHPQLFALVPTEALLDEQPELGDQLDTDAPLTPVAQESLPEGDLADALAQIGWPDMVRGAALAQEIIVLPPEAESELPAESSESTDPTDADAQRLRHAAANHPQRTEARLVVAVLREGTSATVMRFRGLQHTEPAGDEPTDEIVEHPDLAPNLVEALVATFAP